MFLNKTNKNASKLETIIGPETELEGNLRTQQSIRVDGKVKGGIHADSVIIGDFGVVLGDIAADKVTVGGKVKGNIAATSMLELLPKGQILGDIHTEKLIIADGAHFEGNCQMQKVQQGQVIELNPKNGSDESKLKVIANGKH